MQRRPNGIENSVQISINVLVADAHHTPAQPMQIRIAPVVIRNLFIAGMCRTIHLDDKPSRYAGKVGDIGAYRMLTPNAKAVPVPAQA